MRTEEIEFSRINRAVYNPREDLKPGDQAWKDIEASLDEFGQVESLVWNKRTGNLVGGHQRMTILEHKGKDRAFFSVVDLDLAAEKKLNVILNKVGGRWDNRKLAHVLEELTLARIDISTLGLTKVELADLLERNKPKARRDPDAPAPAKPVAPIAKPGNLFELKSCDRVHRLLCGEGDEPDDVRRLMDGHLARLIFTDPPYGVEYNNAQRGDGRRPLGEINNDKLKGHGLREFLTRAFQLAHAHSLATAALYTFHAYATQMDFELALISAGWRTKQQLIWRKHFALSRSHYHWAHEPIFYCAKDGQNCEWFGPRSHTTVHDTSEQEFEGMKKDELLRILLDVKRTLTVWDEARDKGSSYVHPTQKPIGLARRAINNNTIPGEAILDLFGGSGSTMIAAELAQRVSFTMENDPGYIDVMVRRFLETFEGATATRDGQPYSL